MGETTLSGEEGVRTGAQLHPKYACQKNFKTNIGLFQEKHRVTLAHWIWTKIDLKTNNLAVF